MAQCYLGNLYIKNEFIPLYNISKGIHYIKSAAEQNDATAQYHLGNIYYKRILVQKDIKLFIFIY